MATKDQYDFFRGLYEEEERTSQQLEGRAKVYLSVITAFLGARSNPGPHTTVQSGHRARDRAMIGLSAW